MPRSQAEMQLKLLRPELLVLCHDPISSNAYQGITESSEEEDLHAVEASATLRNQVIPDLAMKLDMMVLKAYDAGSLSSEMHKAGVNMRHAGLLLEECTVSSLREQIVMEIVSRASKHVLSRLLKREAKPFRDNLTNPSNSDSILGYFNSILGISEDGVEYGKGEAWDQCARQVQESFNIELSDHLETPLPRLQLALILERSCGVSFSDAVLASLSLETPTALSIQDLTYLTTAKVVEGEISHS